MPLTISGCRGDGGEHSFFLQSSVVKWAARDYINDSCFTNNSCMLNKTDQSYSRLLCSAYRSRPPVMGTGDI